MIKSNMVDLIMSWNVTAMLPVVWDCISTLNLVHWLFQWHADASWQPQANANRLSTTSHQQQRQRQQFHSNKQLPSDPNLASWDGQDDSSNDAASLVPHHMQQQYSRGQSSVLARRSDGGVVASGRQPGGTGVQSRSIRQLSDRGAGEKAAMDALLAKLSAGEPTLQDLAELENML